MEYIKQIAYWSFSKRILVHLIIYIFIIGIPYSCLTENWFSQITKNNKKISDLAKHYKQNTDGNVKSDDNLMVNLMRYNVAIKIIKYISEIAREQGTSHIEVKLVNEQQQAQLIIYQINISLLSDYYQLIKFLDSLSANGMLFRIKELGIMKGKKGLDTSITIDVYAKN